MVTGGPGPSTSESLGRGREQEFGAGARGARGARGTSPRGEAPGFLQPPPALSPAAPSPWGPGDPPVSLGSRARCLGLYSLLFPPLPRGPILRPQPAHWEPPLGAGGWGGPSTDPGVCPKPSGLLVLSGFLGSAGRRGLHSVPSPRQPHIPAEIKSHSSFPAWMALLTAAVTPQGQVAAAGSPRGAEKGASRGAGAPGPLEVMNSSASALQRLGGAGPGAGGAQLRPQGPGL